MKNTTLKGEKGFAASDALIAILIIAIFTGLVATISYNIYLANSSIKRMSTATSYIVDMFEYIDKTYYDDVKVKALKDYINGNTELFNTSSNQVNISSNNEEDTATSVGVSENPQYKIDIYIEYYNKTEEAIEKENKLDLVKRLTVTVSYKLGNRNQEITMNRVKSREKVDTFNKPDIALLEEQTKKAVNPIKNINGKWKVCDERDSTWYNYENGYWAIVVITEEKLELNSEINIEDHKTDGNIHVWIPRYAYNETELLFLFSNSNKKVVESLEGYNTLEQIDESLYTISDEFELLEGIWINDTTSDAYQILNNVYPLNS